MEAFWWLFAIVLMALGLIGTVIPIVPGTTIILAAAVVHRVALGADRSLGMSALIAMLALTLLTYAIDAAAGYMGAKRFGATKWGLIGGAAGALIGLAFGLLGLFVGPVIGAIAGELIGGKEIMKGYRAEEHLRIIRTLMERATIYRAISAPTALAGGVIAITLAAFIWLREHHWAEKAPEVMRHISTRGFASLWLCALAILLALNTFF